MAERRGAAAAALTGGGRGGASPAVAARNSWRCRAGSRRQSQAGLPQRAPALCSPLGRSWALSPLPAHPSPLFLTGHTPGQPRQPALPLVSRFSRKRRCRVNSLLSTTQWNRLPGRGPPQGPGSVFLAPGSAECQ